MPPAVWSPIIYNTCCWQSIKVLPPLARPNKACCSAEHVSTQNASHDSCQPVERFFIFIFFYNKWLLHLHFWSYFWKLQFWKLILRYFQKVQALTAPIDRARLETKSPIVCFRSLIWARSARQWIEVDRTLWPTQHGIQRTAGVMASLWHNQKKKEKHTQSHVSSEWFPTRSGPVCHFPDSDEVNGLRCNVFRQLWNIFKATAVTVLLGCVMCL